MPTELRSSGRAGARLGLAFLLALSSPAAAQEASQRIAALEAEVGRLSASLAAASQPLHERFILAALNLQSALATSRPYTREWLVLRAAAPPEALPAPLADALVSHAGRGLATAAELRESFLGLAPVLISRSPAEGGWLDWLLAGARRVLAYLGLLAAPPPDPAQATVANVSRLLARGQLAPALADVETLDDTLQPLLAGWTAQARARVAVEQAVQETILRALARPGAN